MNLKYSTSYLIMFPCLFKPQTLPSPQSLWWGDYPLHVPSSPSKTLPTSPGRESAQCDGPSAGTKSWASIITCLLSYILLLLPLLSRNDCGSQSMVDGSKGSLVGRTAVWVEWAAMHEGVQTEAEGKDTKNSSFRCGVSLGKWSVKDLAHIMVE